MNVIITLVVLATPAAFSGLQEEDAFRSCLSLSGETAISSCRQALERGLSLEQERIALRSLGQKLASLARWDEAAEAFRREALQAPEDAQALRRHGEVLLFGVGRVSEAVDVLRESLRRDDQQPSVHGWLGAALNILGRHAESVRAFEDALERDPTFFASRPAAIRIFEAAQRGEPWPPVSLLVDE